jgi:hypothetical protein
MNYYDCKLIKRTKDLKGCCWLFIVMLIAIALGALFGSCKSVQFVPVETIRTEIKQIHDTIKIQDSVKNSQQMIIREADTAEIERLNTEFGFKLDKAQKTILVLRRELEQHSHSRTEVKDSIVYRDKEVQVPYPVERKLSKWEQIKIDLGGWMVGFIILSIIVFCIYLARGKVFRGIK